MKGEERQILPHINTNSPKATANSDTFKHPKKVSKIDIAFDNIIDFIQNEVSFRYGKNKKEKDYQQDLEGMLLVLKERYGYMSNYESVNGKHRVDFIVNENIGIEMKVNRGGTQVQKELYNQITDYSNFCPKMIGLVVNITDKNPEILRNEILNKLKYQHAIHENDYEVIVLDVNKS
ncbi:MAG: hypothetical protein K8R11_06960 [Methanococcoides sp.]|nr:hypothetical protein [Methanococcoides sp.]